MKLSAPRSLQGRLLGLVLAIVVAVWLATGLAVWRDARHELDELLDGHLAQAAALLVVQQSHDIGEYGEDDERRDDRRRRDDDGHGDERAAVRAPLLDRLAPRVAFQVFHDGRLVLRSASAPAAPMRPLAQAREGFADVRLDGVDWRVFAARGAERDVLVFVAERTGARDAIVRALLRSSLWPLALALPLLALAAWWAVRRGTAPLRRLSRLLAHRRPDATEPVRLADAPAEMQPMVDALNGLFERIGALMAGERRFTADAAHELRTPIAAIRAQAQVALAERDEGLRAHALRALLQGCDRATRLVEQLLTLSRLEAGDAPGRRTIDLGALTREAVAELAPRAVARSQQLELQADGTPTVQGDETLLRVLLRNLIDNALRYSSDGAWVRVTVGRDAGMVVLRVEDSGPGLDEAQRAHLGERFWRGTQAQSGSGLGWSIVRRIADAHGARAQTQRSAALGGLEVLVVFPA